MGVIYKLRTISGLRSITSDRIHKTLRCMPAMEAGIADQVWEIGDFTYSYPGFQQFLHRPVKNYFLNKNNSLTGFPACGILDLVDLIKIN